MLFSTVSNAVNPTVSLNIKIVMIMLLLLLQVQGPLAAVAARTAAQAWHGGDVVSSLGAVQLIRMLNVSGKPPAGPWERISTDAVDKLRHAGGCCLLIDMH